VKLTGVNVLKETVNVELESEVTVEIPAKDLKGKGKAVREKRRPDQS
jgi:hypothetical protein